MAVTPGADHSGTVGVPGIVFDRPDVVWRGVTPDGQRFLVERTAPASSDEMIVSLEWTRELRRLVQPPLVLPR